MKPRSSGSAWDHPEPFTVEVVAHPDDIDSYGHVNNAVYLRWLERCAWAHSDSRGLPESVCLSLRRGMAVRSVRLEYLAAVRCGDRLLVGNWITANDGKLRVTRHFQIRDEQRGVTVLRGDVHYVCLDLETGRAVRMPPEFIRGYGVTVGS